MKRNIKSDLPTALNRLGGFIVDMGIFFLAWTIDTIIRELIGIPVPTLLLVYIGVFSYFCMVYSASPGKKILGLKVVDKDDYEPIDFWKIISRETVGKFVSGFIVGLGFLWILWDKENQALHDKFFNSMVVKERYIE